MIRRIICGCAIFSLMALLLLIGVASVMMFIFSRKDTSLEGMIMTTRRSVDDSSFDLRFSRDSKSLYVATATSILQYDLNGNLRNRIRFNGRLLSFALNEDGTVLGCLLQNKNISFAEIDSQKLELLSEKEWAEKIDAPAQRVMRSKVVWSDSSKSWITYLGFDGLGSIRTYDCLFVWQHRTLTKESELILDNGYFNGDLYDSMFPIPGVDSIIALGTNYRFILWDHGRDSVIDNFSRGDGLQKYFVGPSPGTYAALKWKTVYVFHYETDEILSQSLERPALPDEDRMFHNSGTIIDITYPADKALFMRQGGPALLESPVFQLLVIFDIVTMEILASEKSKNAHYIFKAVISPDGTHVAAIGNWKGDWKGLTDTLDIYELQ